LLFLSFLTCICTICRHSAYGPFFIFSDHNSLRLDPTNWAAQNNRALCRLKQHNWLGAEADATAVLEPQKALRK
jgi:hypothetical protein